MQRSDLLLLYRGGWSSGPTGVAYPVVLRNQGIGTFWDVELRATHDGEETDRKVVHHVGPQSETDPISLLIPARLCDKGTPGIGLRPLGHAVAEALIEGETVATADLPGGSVEAVQPEEGPIERVPRTSEEEAALLRLHPDGWEYLYFASVLRRRMDALEPKYRDHQLRFRRPAPGRRLEGPEAIEFVSKAFPEARMMTDNFNRVFDPAAQERAFGAPGEPGDEAQIEHLASRVIDVYEGLLDWAAALRNRPVEDEFERVVDLASRFVDQPIQEFRDFVGRTVAEFDRLPSLLRQETPEPVRIELKLVLTIEEGLEAELDAELQRLEEMYEAGSS
jgi:hypothetical protein